MIISYDRLFQETRVGLDDPDPHNPNDDLLMQLAGDEVQLCFNQQLNSPPGWSQQFTPLDVNSGQKIYDIENADGFSKPVRVHTVDPGNPLHVTRKVHFSDRQDVDEVYQGPDQIPIEGWSAQRMIFFMENGVHKVEVFPQPYDARRYHIWYNTGAITEPALAGNIPVPAEFFRYIRIKVQIAAMPYCRFNGKKADKDDYDRKMNAFIKREVENREAFLNFIQTSRRGGSTLPQAYGQWSLDSWY